MVHAFSPSAREAEAGVSLSLRPTWFTEQGPGQQGYTEKPTSKTQNNSNKLNQNKTKTGLGHPCSR